MVKIRQIEVRPTTGFEEYRQFDGPHCCVDEVLRIGREVSKTLAHRRVWMLNSTASGGGVAEMMPRLCGLLAAVGVDARWIVLEPDDPRFFVATKALHNRLHGVVDSTSLAELNEVYAQTSQEGAAALRALVTHHDILVVHDPQPAGLVRYLPSDHLPRLIWRCHIGVAERSPAVQEGWRFLKPYLERYERLLFSSESYIPDELFNRGGVLLPSIDPLSHKSRELRSHKLIGILRSAGLAGGPPPPKWAAFKKPARRWVDGRWEAKPIDDLLYNPLITQVSRFDRLKGFEFLLPAFAHLLENGAERVAHMRIDTERATDDLARVMLLLVGPDPEGVHDDPEAGEVLDGLCAAWRKLPAEVRGRVHLIRLPMDDVRENALAVNALQRQSSVIVQNSLQEGFGLTVTEALWKATPVVASNVGGIAQQMRNAVDGLLIHDPTDTCALGDTMLRMLIYLKQAEKMARSARQRVREHFLITTQVRGWLEEFKQLLAEARHEEPSVRTRTPELQPMAGA